MLVRGFILFILITVVAGTVGYFTLRTNKTNKPSVQEVVEVKPTVTPIPSQEQTPIREIVSEKPVPTEVKDTVPPVVYILEPRDGGKFKSGIVKVVANVTDNIKVNRVEFFFGPENTPMATVAQAPYEYNWDASKFVHAMNVPIQVRAYDDAGNKSYQFIMVNPE